jgi:hypothetical protein
MAGVFIGETFTQKNMPQVGAAIVAGDFGPHPISIVRTPYRTSNLIIEAWPAATGIKLIS